MTLDKRAMGDAFVARHPLLKQSDRYAKFGHTNEARAAIVVLDFTTPSTRTPADELINTTALPLLREAQIRWTVANMLNMAPRKPLGGLEKVSANPAKYLAKLQAHSDENPLCGKYARLYVQWWMAAYHASNEDVYTSLLQDMSVQLPRVLLEAQASQPRKRTSVAQLVLKRPLKVATVQATTWLLRKRRSIDFLGTRKCRGSCPTSYSTDSDLITDGEDPSSTRTWSPASRQQTVQQEHRFSLKRLATTNAGS